jgi:hypothetical protein
MKTQHTQGPWHIGLRRPDSTKFIYDAQGGEVADCDTGTNHPAQNIENARLIAAAPDMLNALERFSEAMKRGKYPELQGIACDAFAALAKAKGES